jgi:RNA polymerase sigma factor (sigma-70 family)
MDCYAAVLEALHEDACRRLRAYKPDGKTKFTTWLVVVVRRLALDALRKRYGRPRSSDPTRRDESVARRRLEDLVAAEIDPDQTESGIATPDANVRRADLSAMLNLAIAELEPSDRLLLTLRFKDDRSVRDTARLMGLPSVFHVYRRVSAVLTQLRETLRSRGVEESEP